MKTLYVDMDGTLAVWDKDASIEEVAKVGYFLHRPEIENVVVAIRIIAMARPDIHMCVLSSVFKDEHSIREKVAWLHEKLPEISRERMVFVPYGEVKSNYVKAKGTFLLDDFSKNLHEWDGIGIKIYNGINGTKGTWHGYSVHSTMKPHILASQLVGILSSHLGE